LWPIREKVVRKRSERGYVILVILFMLALLTLAIVEAAPAVAVDVKRTQEEELIHRGDQYARAIRRFYRKFGRYPNSLDELKDTNHLRFLRHEYKDPITGKEFKLLHPLDVKYEPTGFFGKSLTQPGINNTVSPNAIPPITPPIPPTSSNLDTSSPGVGNTPAGQANQPQTGSQTDSNGLKPGQIFGGGPIVGVSSTSTKASIKEVNGKDHYNDWQFFYDPRMDVSVGQMFQQQNLNNNRNNPNTNNPQ
jgi:type II secretory pathway pseudopilin PulG